MAMSWITAQDLHIPDHPDAESVAEAASQILYSLSGERYGGLRTTSEVYGPSATSCNYGCGTSLQPLGGDAPTAAAVFSTSHGHVTPDDLVPRQIRLRHKPVAHVTAVYTSANSLMTQTPFTKFQIVNDAYLIREDGSPWNMIGGIRVDYSYGTNPPALARLAAIRLGNEMLKSIDGCDDCALPARTTQLQRQGVSLTIMDPQEFLDKGRIGIYEVDLFLAVANPYGAKKKARVVSPDRPRGERWRSS